MQSIFPLAASVKVRSDSVIVALSSDIQGRSRVVFGGVSHHRPAGLHPVQLCCNDHSGDWTVRYRTGNTMILLNLNTISHNACRAPEGGEVVSSKHEAYCVFCAAGGSSRTFLETKPWDSSSLLGIRRAPSWFERVRRPQVRWLCLMYQSHEIVSWQWTPARSVTPSERC